MTTNFKQAMPYILLTMLVVLIFLKIIGMPIPWVWVFFPLWLPVVLIILFTLLGIGAGKASKALKKKQQRDLQKASKENKCKNC